MIKDVEQFLKDYISEFSNFQTEDIIKRYAIPSVLISQEYSKLFLDEQDIDLYYKTLFVVLKNLKYKCTSIKLLEINKIKYYKNDTFLFFVYLNADRLNINNELIVNLNCNYIVEKNSNNEYKFTYVKCSR